MSEVTCILTSCNRFDLLEITLESFFKFNTYPIKEFIIYEDSDTMPYHLTNLYPNIKWVCPQKRTGQIAALDNLWSQVKTEYAFTMEDDWEFIRPGFIENSMDILVKHPKILQIWIHEMEHLNTHPVDWNSKYGVLKNNGNLWAGIRFAPSLKRKADYDLIAPFSKHTEFNREKPWKAEADIAKVYHAQGFKAAILKESYITHIGFNRHVS